jgi:hypothetical protein
MPLDAVLPAPTLVSSQLGPIPKPKGAQGRRKPRPAPDVRLEPVGQPNVIRVVQSFRPLLERLLERARQDAAVIPLKSAGTRPTVH